MDKQLLAQLEELRSEMVETAISEHNNLLHRDVLTLSQMLDEMIVRVQSERRLLARTT
ncbi:aspartyl-phosphate phosphatase Spo0E family protein [Paenibacillus nanensis]|uniref:Aspartyl-phosphate phosphatase Spo0E family protein n=1 Tax=Paenibacillus nanensis TaxID=393251 RepID=A0A3A1UYU5_9BACL|nr:aspartyl-phosphate phosphatase Spo0E family protein [Paenibacillus nanensis]RIX53425.1 aspartyl-phosphate phosphatase Spo0E family protein [Paenibacillus nanensis]